MPSHYLKQCWNIVNWTLTNLLQWEINCNSYIFIPQMHLKMSSGIWGLFCLGLNVLKQQLAMRRGNGSVKWHTTRGAVGRSALFWRNDDVIIMPDVSALSSCLMLQSTGCEIGGECFASGEKNPENCCETCQPGLTQERFSPAYGECSSCLGTDT